MQGSEVGLCDEMHTSRYQCRPEDHAEDNSETSAFPHAFLNVHRSASAWDRR